MKNLAIKVPGMLSVHCQATVTNAIGNLEGVNIQTIQPGIVFISVETDAQKNSVLAVIEKVGYRTYI